MRIRRLWAEVVGPVDAWEDDAVSRRESPRRFEWLEFERSADSWNAQGVRLAKTGDYNAALAAYEKAKTFNPTSAVVRSNLSRAYLRKGDLDEATRELSEACRLDFANVDYSRRLAALHLKRGALEQAEQEFLRATTLAPGEVEIWLELYNAFVEANRLADGVRVLAAARERFPDEMDLSDLVCAGLAQVAAQQAEAGQIEAAEANLAAACKVRSSWPWAKAGVWTARCNITLARERPFRACFAIAIAFCHLAGGTLADWVKSARETLGQWRERRQREAT